MTLIETAAFVTDFADQAVVLPSEAVIALTLAALRAWRRAGLWVLMVVISAGLLLFLKLAGQACQNDLLYHVLRSPSGHTMSATVLYGGMFLLAGVHTRGSILAAIPIAALTATTRLVLRAHTPSEVLVGAAIGLAALATFGPLINPAAGPAPQRPSTIQRWLPTMLGLLAAAITHGHRSTAEQSIHYFARHVVGELLRCTGV